MDVLKTHVIKETVEILSVDTIVCAREDTEEETVTKVENFPCEVNFTI